MATFVFAANQRVNSANLSLEGVTDYASFSGSTTELRFFDDADNFTRFGGSGINFTVFGGVPIDVSTGFITQLSTFVNGSPVISITGLGIDAPQLYDLVVAGDSAAVRNLFLRGDDTMTLSDLKDKVNAGDGNDFLFGKRGHDVLTGGRGNDTLSGDQGNDTLTGGAGSDRFLFDERLNATTNVDTITDFNVLQDKFYLDTAVFRNLGAGDTVNAARFVTGAPQDDNDRLIYDSATGALSYDRDGNGSAAAIKFAQLDAGLALTADHFVLIS